MWGRRTSRPRCSKQREEYEGHVDYTVHSGDWVGSVLSRIRRFIPISLWRGRKDWRARCRSRMCLVLSRVELSIVCQCKSRAVICGLRVFGPSCGPRRHATWSSVQLLCVLNELGQPRSRCRLVEIELSVGNLSLQKRNLLDCGRLVLGTITNSATVALGLSRTRRFGRANDLRDDAIIAQGSGDIPRICVAEVCDVRADTGESGCITKFWPLLRCLISFRYGR